MRLASPDKRHIGQEPDLVLVPAYLDHICTWKRCSHRDRMQQLRHKHQVRPRPLLPLRRKESDWCTSNWSWSTQRSIRNWLDARSIRPWLIGQTPIETGEKFLDYRNHPTPNWFTANKKVRNAISDLANAGLRINVVINTASEDIAL